jgi:hypothetical protein
MSECFVCVLVFLRVCIICAISESFAFFGSVIKDDPSDVLVVPAGYAHA